MLAIMIGFGGAFLSRERMLLLLVTGVSRLVAVAINASGAAATAFVGTPTGHRTKFFPQHSAPTIRAHDRIVGIVSIPSTPTSLFGSVVDSASEPVALLEGKLAVLQDVVKQLDARHQSLRDQSEAANAEHQETLDSLKEDLAVSEAAMEDRRSALAAAERVLEEAIERHASELAAAEETGRRATERALADLEGEHRAALDGLRREQDRLTDRLREDLAGKTGEAEEISARWTEAEKETARIRTEKDRLIEELRSNLEDQQGQLKLLENERDEALAASAAAPDKNDDDNNDNDEKIREQLDAANAAAEERLAGLRADLEAEHRGDIEKRQAEIDALTVENRKLTTELADRSARHEEQIAIATASVRAGETREANLRAEAGRWKADSRWRWLLLRMAILASDAIDADNRRLTEERNELARVNGLLEDDLREVLDDLERAERNSRGTTHRTPGRNPPRKR